MRVWQRFVLCLLVAALTLGLATTSFAVTISGRASTVIEWYDTATEETATPVHQYLQFSLVDIAEKGYNFKAYGRLSDDFSNEVNVDSRLYYAYLEKQNLFNGVDFRLGRQFISTSAGASLMDGLMIDKKLSDTYQIKLFGGGDVRYYQDYDADDMVLGAELGGEFLSDKLVMNISYLQKREDGDLDVELFGLDVGWDLSDRLYIYSETQYNWLNEQVSYQLLGTKYRCSSPFALRLEYLYSLPVFSASSIYSVFAVEEYEEFLAEATWSHSRDLRSFLRYSHEFYDEFADANVYEIGIEKLRTDKLSGYLSAVLRDDKDGQDMYGFKARAAYKFMPQLEAGVGLEVDVLDREIVYFDTDDTGLDETTSSRVTLFGKYKINDRLNVEGKVERLESDIWDYYFRGRVRLNILF